MKTQLFILTFTLCGISYGQTCPALEKTLAKELPEKSTTDGRWVFYPNRANIKKIEKPLIKAIVPSYDFYEVVLTNYLGWHVNQGTCVVLFDSIKSRIILVEPLWYGGTSRSLLKLFIGHKFPAKDSIIRFLTELNELMQVGSGYKYRQTSITDTAIRYDLGYFKGDTYTTGGNGVTSTTRYNDDGVWRKIIVDIDKLKVVRYTEINPITNDKEVIQ